MMEKMKIPVVMTAVFVLLFAGCASLEAQKRLKEYEGYFEPLVGKAQQAEISRRFGAPLRKDRIGNSEFWYYHIPTGTRKARRGAEGSKEGMPWVPRARSTTT